MKAQLIFAAIFCSTLYILPARAEASPSCYEVLGQISTDLTFANEILPCLEKNADVAEAIKNLCVNTEKQLKPSAQLQKYFEYKLKFDQAGQDLLSAKNPADRAIAQANLSRAKTMWGVRGFREPVSRHLNYLSRAHYFCKAQ